MAICQFDSYPNHPEASFVFFGTGMLQDTISELCAIFVFDTGMLQDSQGEFCETFLESNLSLP